MDRVKNMLMLITLLFATVLVLGILIREDNIYAAIIYGIIGIAAGSLSGYSYYALSNETDQSKYGKVIVFCSWMIISLSLAGMCLFLSDFLMPAETGFAYISFSLCFVGFIGSIYDLIITSKETDTPLAI